MAQIFLAAFPHGVIRPGDVLGCAMAEDGHVLAEHLSSNVTWAKHDLGLVGDWQHDHYRAHYPDGYELVWVDNPKTHEGWQAALALNQQFAPADEPEQEMAGR